MESIDEQSEFLDGNDLDAYLQNLPQEQYLQQQQQQHHEEEDEDEDEDNDSWEGLYHYDLNSRELEFNNTNGNGNNGNEILTLNDMAYNLEQSIPIRNHRYHLTIYENVFIGSDCIDYLVRSKFADSRSAAVNLGRRMAKELNLFEHVTLDHELKDDYLFYRFIEVGRRTSNSYTTNRVSSSNSSSNNSHPRRRRVVVPEIRLQVSEDLEVIARILRKEIDVRDRTYRLRKYKNCFVASEVVTLMIMNNLVQSREEGVELGRRLQKEVNLWHHVVRAHIFKDDYLFFRFSTPATTTTTTTTTTTKTTGGRGGERSSSRSSTNNDAMDLISETGSVVSVSVSVQDMAHHQLHSVAEQLRRGLRVKDRRYHLRIYKSCFVASEAVDFMVKQNLARSREEAVDLGRLLATEFHLWYHVTNDHFFDDKYLFFRFAPASDQSLGEQQQSVSSSTSSTARGPGISSDQVNQNMNLSLSTNSIDLSAVSSEHSLTQLGSKLLRGIQVKDRIYKLKVYKSCFVGAEAVDFMVQARITSSREEAVELGQRLLQERNLFHHVVKKQPFKDGYFFYRFSNSVIDDGSIDSSLESSLHSGTNGGGGGGEDNNNKSSSSSVGSHSIKSMNLDDLIHVGEQLRRGVRIKNRSYRLKMYKNCFIGSEAVDYLVQSGLAESRTIAVDMVRRLASELDFLHHVTYEHAFEDGYFFFRFKTTDRTTSTNSSRSTWSSLSSGQSSLSDSLREFVDMPAPNGQRLQFERNPSLRKTEYLRLRQIRKEIPKGVRVVLVRGSSGVGKSALIEHAFATDNTSLYGAAKFDQRSNFAPFQALRLLFSDLSKRLRFSPHLAKCQFYIGQEFKDSRVQQSALISWIPEMQALFADSCEDEHLKRRSDIMNVMKIALQSFLRAVTSVTPVILCMDDIMWSDQDTLNILQFLLNQNMKNLLFCATYRDELVTDEHILSDWCLEVSEEVNLETIHLQNLTQSEIQDFLSNCLRREPEDVKELGELLLERTLGNLFFLAQTLESLQNLSLLHYDYARLQWVFSVEHIRSKTLVADNVGELLSRRIEQLPRDVQQVLKLGSCFGNSFDPEILEWAKSALFIFGDIYVCLQLACKEELLIQASEREYMFSHDHCQAASYQLLPKGRELKKIHWDIGYRLSTKQLSQGEDDAGWYFACADQINLSEEVMLEMIRDADRPRIARLFRKAGEKAAEMSAFVPAAAYFKTGIDLLGSSAKKAFSTRYDLAVRLFIFYAKAQLSAGKVDESRKASDSVLALAKTDEDKREANLIIFRCLFAENKLDEQIDFGLRLLEEWGRIKIPKNPNFMQVSLEYELARKSLRGYTDEEILSIPPMSDKNVEFCIDLMCDLGLSGNNLGRGTFVCFTLARLVQLTLKHGLCRYTPFIFVLVGQDVIANFNDLKEGYRYVQVGLRCQTVVETAEEKGRLLTQSCMALGCVEPISKCMYLGLDAYKASMEVGDIHNAFFGASVYLWSFLYSGLPFKPLLDDVEKFALQMLEYEQTMFFFQTIPLFQFLLCLSGQEDDPSDITQGRAIEMNSSVESGKQEETGKESLLSYGMQLSLYMGKIEKATEIYVQLRELDKGVAKATISYHARLFFFSLICVENFRSKGKILFKTKAKKHMDTLRELVEGGAINLVHKVQLLDAEYTSLSAKDTREVISKYEKAIVSASRAGFLQDGALANYLCAQYCLRHDNEDSAQSYLVQSYNLYSTWGASAVAESVKERHPLCFPNDPAASSTPLPQSSGFRSRTNFRASFALMHKSLSRSTRRIHAKPFTISASHQRAENR